MDNILKGALVANAASLGLTMIYNLPYLERLSKSEPLAFQPVDPAKYKRARKATFGYPGAEVGDLTFEGSLLRWLVQALEDNADFSGEAYRDLLYDKIRPGGAYKGFVPELGNRIVFNKLNETLETGNDPVQENDDTLLGFLPYLAAKSSGVSNENAWALTGTFTDDSHYVAFFKILDNLFEALESDDMKEAIEKQLEDVPTQFRFKFMQAMHTEDTKPFLQHFANTGPSIHHALPLAFHILYHTDSFEAAVEKNLTIGGASAERALLIGAIRGKKDGVSKEWADKTKL